MPQQVHVLLAAQPCPPPPPPPSPGGITPLDFPRAGTPINRHCVHQQLAQPIDPAPCSQVHERLHLQVLANAEVELNDSTSRAMKALKIASEGAFGLDGFMETQGH